MFVFVLVLCLGEGLAQGDIVLGGIFDENQEQELTFVDAVDTLNSGGTTFVAVTKNMEGKGPYQALKMTCDLLSEQAVVIFGPKNEENINIVQATCDYKDIPHVITRWTYNPQHHSTLINFYPHSKYLTAAYLSILKWWKWKSFTVFYEDNESILRMSELIREAKELGIIVSVKQLDEQGYQNYRTTLKEALLTGEKHYVIDCKIDILETVLIHAQQVGMMTSFYNYFITNLDLHTIDLEPFQYSGAYISGIRLVNPENPELKNYWYQWYGSPHTLNTETALLIDAIKILSDAVQEHGITSQKGINCNSTKGFRHGATISSIVKGKKFTGLSGRIEFDNEGLRSNFDLEVLELNEDAIHKVGTWNYTNGISTIPKKTEVAEDEDVDSLRNKTFIVITCLTDPYCMLKESHVPLTGNDRFEGFAIDLIEALAAKEGFNYTFELREDKQNGAKDKKTGQWTGMIGDVMADRAHLAITDLTINREREEAVDFTSPFMNLGISILAKEPTNAPPSFFTFADPFALDTWIGLALAYALTTFSFFIIGRLCPDEWTNPYPCIEEPEYLVNQFTLSNSAWFAVGALLQQGTEIAPMLVLAISTRMTAAFWWFFVLIMVSSYTANLAAFLATANPVELFSDVHTLAKNMEKYNIKLGAKENGSTEVFFKNKEPPKRDDGSDDLTDETYLTYKKIADYMKNHREDLVTDNKIGVRRAEDETYAFFMESISIEYEIQRHCSLKQYGKLLDEKGYGIAMKKNSTYRKRLSTAILTLQASGQIDKMKRKWWEEKRGGGQCSAEPEAGGAEPLHLENMEGCFYVTIIGTICSVFLVLFEMLIATVRLKKRAKMSFREAFKIEMKAFLNFNSNVKSVITAKSESKSPSGSAKGSQQTFNNNLKPELPYGFIPAITKQEFTDKSS